MRDTHLPIEDNLFFSKRMLKKATKISFFEKFCLWFIKPKYIVNKIEGNTLVFKDFRGKRYILNHFYNPPSGGFNCRCTFISINKPPN